MNIENNYVKCLLCLSVFLINVSFTSNVGATLRDLCVPTISSFGDPIIDGEVDNQNWLGANKVNLSADAGATRSAIMQMGTSGGFLYISLIIDSAFINVGEDNRIVLGLSPNDGVSTHDWKIHFVLSDAVMPDSTNEPVYSINYWRDSSNWNSAAPEPTVSPTPGGGPSWLHDSNNIRYTKNGNRFSIEMRIPLETNVANAGDIDKVYLPSGTSTFQYYINYLETANLGSATVVAQNPWPHNENITAGTDNFLNHNTPEPIADRWGSVSLFDRTDCDGVSLDWWSVGVENPSSPGTIINNSRYFEPVGGFTETDFTQCDSLANNYLWPGSKSPINNFIARPYNGMASNVDVSATFYIANFGIPAPDDWKKLGEYGGSNGLSSPPDSVANNPTSPPATITPGNTANLIASWILSYKQSCAYSKVGHWGTAGNQCILVELDSPQVNTRFKNKSQYANIFFGPASRLDKVAIVSGNQGPLLSGQKHKFILVTEKYQGRMPTDPQDRKLWLNLLYGDNPRLTGVVSKSTKTKSQVDSSFLSDDYFSMKSQELTEAAANIFGKGVTDLCALIVRGYLESENSINISGTDYKVVEKAGDFGVVGGHAGQITGCEYALKHDELRDISNIDNIFRLDVSPGTMAELLTSIEAVEAKYALNVLVGINAPHSSFSNVADSDVSYKIGIEYFYKANLTFEGVLGSHSFENKGLGSDLDIIQLSLNVRQYYTPAYVRPFINAGLGMYKLDPGDDEFGYNIGAGIQYDFTPRLSLEAAYNYHAINASNIDPQFSTLQIGTRYLF